MGKSLQAEAPVEAGPRGLGETTTDQAPATGGEAERLARLSPGPQLPPEAPDFEFALPRKLRPGRGQRTWLIGQFCLAVALSLVAGTMAIAIRGTQDVAHYLGTFRAWGVDAYSCALVGGIAVLAWTGFFAAVVRCIREAKLAPAARERWSRPARPAPAETKPAAGTDAGAVASSKS